jgi:dipeptidyl aminopeptidase/acylaminoacyl peptidase
MLPSLLQKVAWLGLDFIKPPISSLMLRFAGLGYTGMKTDLDGFELELSQAGVLTIVVYHDPWGWMNPRTRNLVDDVIEAIRLRHQLDPALPLFSTGGSMGGHAALLYSLKSRHRVTACMAVSPVCDLPFHYTERPDLPRTMHHAFDSYDNIDAALREHSPLHQIDKMPDIPYIVVHGAKDASVNKAAHSDRLVAGLRARKLNVEYIECPIMVHCGPTTYEVHRRTVDFILRQLQK